MLMTIVDFRLNLRPAVTNRFEQIHLLRRLVTGRPFSRAERRVKLRFHSNEPKIEKSTI